MEAIDKIIVIVVGLLGILALGCAVFAGAYWHYFTFAACAALVLVSTKELKNNE